MTQLKEYYTLEKHLEEYSKLGSQFETLNAVWKLNKKGLSAALNNVSQIFPHYSLHEKSHSETIIANIESFLGEDRIIRLSPTDTWLILMSCYTHDIGMIILSKMLDDSWNSDVFQDYLNDIDSESELGKDAKLVLDIQSGLIRDNKDLSIILNIKYASIRLCAEYFRRQHHERSYEILSGKDREFSDLIHNFYSGEIPNRIINVLADVAFLHGEDFYKIFERLEYKSNGIASDKIHPRFVACLLRLGDLLDVDDLRFNPITRRVFPFPNTSENHVRKHSSIKHLLITPSEIEITAICEDEEVYSITRSWFNWLEIEVSNQSKEWSNIMPDDLGGNAPTIPRGKVKVLHDSENIPEKFMNQNFRISNKKMFSIIEGQGIYEQDYPIFIRELYQNAYDSIKLQMWIDIESGIYDSFIMDHLELSDISHENLIKKIVYPTDIPDSIYKAYYINLTIDMKKDSEDTIYIQVEDNGTGIPDDDIYRLINCVGEDRKREKEFKELLDRIPYFIKPTCGFGIGLQSVFVFANEFTIETKSAYRIGRTLKLRSPKKNLYNKITVNKDLKTRGTQVYVEVKLKRIDEVLTTSFPTDIIDKYDFYTSNIPSLQLSKTINVLQGVLLYLSHFKVNFFGENYNHTNIITIDNSKTVKNEEDDIRYLLFEKIPACYKYNGQIQEKSLLLRFIFFDRTLKSTIYASFAFNEKEYEYWPGRIQYSVRGVKTDKEFRGWRNSSYCKFHIDLLSESSNDILQISRDNFTELGKERISGVFHKEVLPKLAKLLNKVLTERMNEDLVLKDLIEKCIFDISLTLITNGVELDELCTNALARLYMVPLVNVRNSNEDKVTLYDFLASEELICYGAEGLDHARYPKDLDNYLRSKGIEEYLIVADKSYISPYLRVHYHETNVWYLDNGSRISKLSKKPLINNKVEIEGNLGYYYQRFIPSIRQHVKRSINRVHSKYADKLSVNNVITFESPKAFNNHHIVSPFGTMEVFKEWQERCKNGTVSLKDVKEFIPSKLVKRLLDHKPEHIHSRTENDIYEGYHELITDIFKHLDENGKVISKS